jgi:hypothetical protein
VKNVHVAAAAALTEIDRRFAISSSYVGGITTFNISAVEPVPLNITFDGEKYPEVEARLHDLFACGKDFEVEASAVLLKGSPLFDTIARECATGKFGIQAPRGHVKLKSYVVLPDSKDRLYLDDVDAVVSAGSERATIFGEGWVGLLSIALSVPMRGRAEDAGIELTFDIKSWEGIDVGGLPYFVSLSKMFESLSAGGELFVSVHAQGQEILASKSIRFSSTSFVTETAAVLEYVKLVRDVAKLSKASILFRGNQVIRREDYQAVAEAAHIANGEFRIPGEKLLTNPRLQITAGSESQRLIEQVSGDQIVQICDQSNAPISAFGQAISLPLCTTTFAPVRIRCLEAGPFVVGQRFEVELEMLDASVVTKEFQPPG